MSLLVSSSHTLGDGSFLGAAGRCTCGALQSVFRWWGNSQIPSRKGQLGPFYEICCFCQSQNKATQEKGNVGTGSKQMDAAHGDCVSLSFDHTHSLFLLGTRLDPIAGPTCCSERKAEFPAQVARFYHAYCVGGKKQCDILAIINPEKKSNHSEGSMALSSDSQTFWIFYF